MASWQNDELIKWQWFGTLAECQVNEMLLWWNNNEIKWQIREMPSW
jgi:hypothetical protein